MAVLPSSVRERALRSAFSDVKALYKCVIINVKSIMLYVARNEQDCQAGHVVFSSALTTRTGVRRSAFLVNSFARSLTANECNARWLAVCHATVVLVVTAGRRACPVRRPHSHRTASSVAAVAGLPVVAYYRDTLFAADAHLDGRGRRRNKAWDGRAAV